MANIEQEMEGVDFDWFAIDQSGNWAVFATAGEGFIPESVLKYADLHSFISEKINLPNWGRSNIWHDYAVVGLFAFDWDSAIGGYIKKASPDTSVKFIPNTKNIAVFPSFEVEFTEVIEVKVKK